MQEIPPVVVENEFDEDFEDDDEEFFDWWHYSKFALPWLLFCLIMLATLFCLTFWQQSGDIKHFFDGVPRLVILKSTEDSDTEAGMPKNLRNLRIASLFFGVFGVVLSFLLYFARPAPGARKGLGILCCLLLIVAAVLSWIAFGVGLDNHEKAVRCEEGYRFTGASCRDRTAYAVAAIVLNAAVGTIGVIAGILVAYNSLKGHWRLPPRSISEEARDREVEPHKPRAAGHMIQANVSYVRRYLTAIFLIFTLISLIALATMVILLTRDRDYEYIRSYRGRSASDLDPHSTEHFEQPGWPALNTRLRYAATAIGIVAILFNFMPFRSKTVALVFAFFYFTVACMLIIAFGFDIYRLQKADELPCGYTIDGLETECQKSQFIATAWFDFFIAICLLLYVLLEYVVNGRKQPTYDSYARPYGVFYLPKPEVTLENNVDAVKAQVVDRNLREESLSMVRCGMCEEAVAQVNMPDHVVSCPCRPVSCDACGETYRTRDLRAHKEVCGEALTGCDMCGDQLQRYRLKQHQQMECAKRMVLCDECGEAMPCYRLDRHKNMECAGGSPQS